MDQGQATAGERRALVGSSLAITAMVVLQAPGRILPETKLEVALDPVGFLARALGAWDPSAAFGRVQNQAVGYLFPMGPFMALGQVLGLPPWMVQRAWIATVIVASTRRSTLPPERFGSCWTDGSGSSPQSSARERDGPRPEPGQRSPSWVSPVRNANTTS